MRRVWSFAAVLACAAGLARAEGDALVIGNEAYSVFDRLSGAARVLSVAESFERQGVSVTRAEDAGGAALEAALADFVDGLDGRTERVVVILSGRFAHLSTGAYLLPVGMTSPLREGEVLAAALPLATVLGILADYPGQAVLALAEGREDPLGARHLEAGTGDIAVPQGVTLLRGSPAEVARIAERTLAVPGAALRPAAEEAGVVVTGFAPRTFAFLPRDNSPVRRPEAADVPRAAGPLPTGTDTRRDPEEERRWTGVRDRDEIAGYRAYLGDYPQGRHAAEARDRIAALEADPRVRAQAAEAALGLDRAERQAIQRDLALLDYDTRGIDGIFGSGTRSAIEGWQRANDAAATGFLTRGQIDILDAQAARRQAELEAEAARREAELARQDRAYWQDTGAEGTYEGLRAYLDRYPDGSFAEAAQERLDEIEASRRAEAQSRDRQAWQRTREAGTAAAYRDYLSAYPEGAFAGDARAALAELEQGDARRQAAARAEAEEAALNLPRTARRLAEGRLRAAGYDPGEVDGTFDKKARRAIRRYQDARSLAVTGYLDQATVVRLLADSLLSAR